MLEKLAAKISRNLYAIPGGYYLVKCLMKLFKNTYGTDERIYSFKKIVFKVNINTYLGKLLYWRGAHEWGPIFALKKIIKKDFICIDVGANQGEYTLWMAKLAGKNGKIIAFEPLTKMFNQLNENIQLNQDLRNQIITLKKGLSDVVGEIPIYAVNPDDKFSDNEGMPTIFPTNTKNTFIENIPLSTLDIECENLQINKLNFIKIDVEGAELNVIKGGINTIKKFKPVLLIEFNEATFNAAGYTSKHIIDLLSKLGYKFYLIGVRGTLKKLDLNNIPQFCNVLAKV